jgi:tripartite-type tricarboxylate transporter receptor subunit TctC
MALALSVWTATAIGQPRTTYPDRPIRLIVPYATGAGTDIGVRILSPSLATALGQQVVVDNRPGAGGIIGAELAAKAAPDGYTLVIGSISYTILPSIHRTLPYDIVKDFAPISLLVAYPFLLVVPASLPAKSVKEFIALAKASPGQINYASAGNGTVSYLSAEYLKSLTGIHLVHVPYKGVATAITGIFAGEASLGIYSASATLPHVKAGRLRALAATGERRSATVPDLPTVAEAGVPGYEVSTWFGALAQTGTPKSIVARLHGELTRIVQLPEIKDRLAANDFETVGNTPDEFSTFIKKEIVKWAKVVKASGAKLD